ncbi:S-adenosyl-L-methionine-dependent methyltransferase [Schizophyllum fasciatum]
MSPSSSPSPLRALVNTLSDAVSAIDGAFAAAGHPYPALSAPFDPAAPAEALFAQADVAAAAETVAAASVALAAAVGTPQYKVLRTANAHTASSALRVAIDGAVAEILRPAGAEGLPVNEIAAKNGLDAGKLGRILRKLASVHVFREVSPNVFANNRLSSVLDTGKEVDAIRADATAHFTGTGPVGFAALCRHLSDVSLKGSAYLYETLTDEERGRADAAEKAAVPFALKTEFATYEWYEQPGNEGRLACFSAAMKGQAAAQVPDVMLKGFDFSALPPGSAVVDVGAGVGHMVMSVVRRFPALRAVVEDRPAVLARAREYWHEELPGASVAFVAQDFFEPQAAAVFDAQDLGERSHPEAAQPPAVTGQPPAVFLLFHVLHNWGRARALVILRHLRAAAGGGTRLVVGEHIAPYACCGGTADDGVGEWKGAGEGKDATNGAASVAPLLAPGKAEYASSLDMIMLIDLNGEERTLGTFAELAAASGWHIVAVHRVPGNADAHIVAEPV